MKPERLARRVIYESPWVNLYLDKVRFSNGAILEEHHLLDFPCAAVAAIVEDERRNVLMVGVWRYTTGTRRWEVPAGGMENGESEIDTAKREVLEETGYTSAGHELIYSYHPMGGTANKLFHIVRCKAGERVQDFDHNEIDETRWFSRDEVKQMIQDKTLTDGLALTALLLWLQS